ncbi:hypothetical protein J6590_061815 [Homalodisca vitripennis]|nr:hypothetical protein J6590_061815 [Homalodisca vitripennis]
MSVATSFTVFAMLLLVVAGNDLEEQPSTSNGLRRSQPIPVPGAIRDRYFTTDSGSIVHLNMNNGDDRATLPVLQREVTRVSTLLLPLHCTNYCSPYNRTLFQNEYEAQIQRMFRSGQWVTTRRGRLHVISAGLEEDESQPSTLGWTGDANPNITLPSDISEESLIAAADRAIAEASTFPDEATQRVVMEESNSSSDEAISLSTSWDFRRNPSTRRQSSEDLSQFYRRLNQSIHQQSRPSVVAPSTLVSPPTPPHRSPSYPWKWLSARHPSSHHLQYVSFPTLSMPLRSVSSV